MERKDWHLWQVEDLNESPRVVNLCDSQGLKTHPKHARGDFKFSRDTQ